MKRFGKGLKELLKILVMAVVISLPVLFLCLYLRFYPMNYSDGEAPYYFWNKDVSQKPSERYYSTLVMGDSAANAAYLPEAMSEGTINLSLGGTTIIENYYVLQDWLAHQEAPKTIYISFMDYHLVYDNMFYERTVYSHRLTYEQEKEILKTAREYQDENIAIEDGELKLFEYNYYLPKYYLPALLNGGFSERKEENEAHYAQIDLHRGAYIGLSNEMYTYTDQNTYSTYYVNPLYEQYYHKFLDLCQEKAIQVRIVALPKTGNSVLTSQFHEERDGFYRNLVSGYHNAMYFDEVDTCDGRYFLDWEHFNVYGGWMWSSFIRNRFPQDFESEPTSSQTLAGIADYLKLAKEPDLMVDFANGKDLFAIAITNRTDSMLEKFQDTEQEIDGKRIYLQNGTERNLLANEMDGDSNTIVLTSNEDGTHAIYLSGEWYPVTIEPYADLTLIFINALDHTVFSVRNFKNTGTGLVG